MAYSKDSTACGQNSLMMPEFVASLMSRRRVGSQVGFDQLQEEQSLFRMVQVDNQENA